MRSRYKQKGQKQKEVRTDYEMQIHDLTVTVSRRRIKNVNIYIRPNSDQILVTAPLYIDDDFIHDFLERKYDWILTNVNKISQRGKIEKPQISEADILHLQELITYYANKWEPIMGVHCVKWTIRDMKTRWGSCSVNKATIRINLQLATKQPECVEYIIVHELTHLLEASHNKVFKAYMTRFLPDWKERDRLLRQS